MTNDKETILKWIEEDKDRLVEFFSTFLKQKSPNPPGDTRSSADVAAEVLKAEGLDYQIVAPEPTMPNIIASFDGDAGEGKHLVLNGHMDVFPADDDTPSGRSSWSGDVEEGKVYGRGACDMKAGTTASLFTYIYMNRLRDRLRGKLSLTMVSDEETFGPWGAEYLMENHPEVHGDCCLNGEPSSAYAMLFAERGLLWLEFTVNAEGAHGSFSHQTEKSAVSTAIRIIQDLESIRGTQGTIPEEIEAAIAESDAALVSFSGDETAGDVSRSVQVNIGRIEGGHKVNMMPMECRFEADIRIPIGLTPDDVMAMVKKIVSNYPQVNIREMKRIAPNWNDPNADMVKIIRNNARDLKGVEPPLLVSSGSTDCRLWRFRGIPAFSYGPSPLTMATADEWVDVEDFLHVVRAHALCAYDYLSTKVDA